MPDIKFTPVDEIPQSKTSAGAGRPGKYVSVFEYLRANPGKTVKLDGRLWPSVATRIKRGEVKGCDPGEFFATCRNVDHGQADIYVTYVGPKPNEDFHERTVSL